MDRRPFILDTPDIVITAPPERTFIERLQDLMRQGMTPKELARQVRHIIYNEQRRVATLEPWRHDEVVEPFWVLVRGGYAHAVNEAGLLQLTPYWEFEFEPHLRVLFAERWIVREGWLVSRPDGEFIL